ncbi:MAG: hypothetical protein ACXW4E_01460, partial [Anaerolineales bacterium]
MTVPAITTLEMETPRAWRHVVSVLARDPLSLASLIIITVFILMAIFAEVIAPYPEQGAGR